MSLTWTSCSPRRIQATEPVDVLAHGEIGWRVVPFDVLVDYRRVMFRGVTGTSDGLQATRTYERQIWLLILMIASIDSTGVVQIWGLLTVRQHIAPILDIR